MNSYIYILKRNMIGETLLKLKSDKVPFQIDDIIYISGLDKIIHSRWKVTDRNDRFVALSKIPEDTVSIDFEKVLSEKFTERITLIAPEYLKILEKHFNHKIIIKPFYDVASENNVENSLLEKLRKADFDIEVYMNSLVNTYSGKTFSNNNFIIMKNYGVISFVCCENDFFSNKVYLNEFKRSLSSGDDTYKLLSNSSMLTNDGINLNIGYKKYYIINSNKDKEKYLLLNKGIENSGRKNLFVVDDDIFIEALQEEIKQNSSIVVDDNKDYGIKQMLIPQYVNSKSIDVSNRSSNIEFKPLDAYELDGNQKSVLTRMNTRTYIKAVAGSGKTIMLLAKAYEVAKANQDKEFLIICFNNKLADDIRIQASNTGKMISNLKVITFDKFIELNYSNFKGKTTTETFNTRRKMFVEMTRNGKIKKKYGVFFLDEMQQLSEDWIESLIACLDHNKYMVMAGDYYQQLQFNDEKEQSDDDDEIIEGNEKTDFYIGKYNFQKIVFDRNYRNTDIIVKTLNKMLNRIQFYIKLFRLKINDEELKFNIGNAIRIGNESPEYIKVHSDKEEIKIIIDNIMMLLNKKLYTPNEILLVSPWGEKNNIINSIEKELRNKGIEICNFRDSNLRKDGIRIGTIGKSIGLDFKAVIIFGTRMLKKSREEDFEFNDLEKLKNEKRSRKAEFIRYLKNIYVACSRARDTLIVIDDIKEQSLISDFLKIIGE